MSKTTIAKVFKNIGGRHLLMIILSAVMSLSAIAYMGSMLYKSVDAELELKGEMDVIQSSDRFSQYLMFDKNELTVASYSVNKMIVKGASNEQILSYMETQSSRMKNALDKSFTGLYGYINDEYLDGSGWVPDKDFVPTERPWYKAALAHPNETVYVDPYVDEQTGKVMITIAELLDDEESVLALDIGLSGVQTITDAIALDTPGAAVMVLDGSNVVIAHSKKSEVGKDYAKEADSLGGKIVKRISNKEESGFEIWHKGKSYMVFCKQIEGGWHCASVIDTDTFYKPIVKVIIVTIIVGIISLILLLLIFYRLSLRELSNKDLHIQIQAAADVYEYLLDIDLNDNSFQVLNDPTNYGQSDLSYSANAQEVLLEKVEAIVDDGSKAYVKEFANLATINKRMKDKDTLTVEYLNNEHKWYRARFICADRLPDGTVGRVLLGSEKIDAEKKEREYLRHMAETDLMTGIFNRITGEFKIKLHLESGRGGMFVLFDIDHFKQFNDTFGHQIGDKVIISVANCLKNSFRGDDVVMRIGGDEFAAYAPGVHTKAAGEMILARFFDNLDNVVIDELGTEKVTVSAGAVFSPDDEPMSFKEMYEAADESMYECKQSYQFHTVFAGCFREQ